MAYDEALADRIRRLVEDQHDVTEQKMFGGLAFLVNGNMAIAASGQGGLLVRVEPAEADAIMLKTAAQPMTMRGRSMKGWVYVTGEDVRTKRQLANWLQRGTSCARSLPSKAKTPVRRK